MYQNNYSYGYSDPYMNEISNFRQLANQVGSFITVTNHIPLAGFTIVAGTRVFIHSVRLDAAGNELVKIVFPQVSANGNCIIGSSEVLGSALTAPPGIQYFSIPRSYPTYL